MKYFKIDCQLIKLDNRAIIPTGRKRPVTYSPRLIIKEEFSHSKFP